MKSELSMYRVPSDLDFGFCTGSTLNQIAIGKYDVQFLFDSGAKIAVQGNVSLLRDGVVEAQWNEFSGWSSLEFQSILNMSVESAGVESDTIIQLVFDGGLVLHLYDSSDQYETMQIYGAASLPILII